MQPPYGEPVKGEVHAADASTAAQVLIYNVGSLSEHVLLSDEFIRISAITVVTSAAADVHVFIGADATPGTGETIIRGSFAANGGVSQSNIDVAGGPAHKIFVLSSASAIVDVNLKASVHRIQNGVRPDYQQSLIPGH